MTQADKIKYYQRFSKVQQNRERIYAPKIKLEIWNQYQVVVLAITRHNESPQEAMLRLTGADFAPVIRKLYYESATIFGGYVNSIINKERRVLVKRSPLAFAQQMIELINRYYLPDILNVCEQISQTTKESITDILGKALENQWSINDIVREIEALRDGNVPAMRARRIARTESVAAANIGAVETGKNSGLLCNKEWLTTLDSRTRHDHSAVNGQKVGLDGLFSVGGYQMIAPGDKGGVNGRPRVPAKEIVNCRCATIVEPARDRNGRLIEAPIVMSGRP